LQRSSSIGAEKSSGENDHQVFMQPAGLKNNYSALKQEKGGLERKPPST
jgi:hypothetical protein